MYDYGLLLETKRNNDEIKLLKNKYKVNSKIILGYSLSNVGEFISFGNPSYMSDLAPRLVRAGIAINFIIFKNNQQVFSWNSIRSAEDVLIRRTRENDVINDYYERGFGDINFIDHIIFGFPSNKIILSQGNEIRIKKLFSLRLGSKTDLAGKIDISTYGLSINTSSLIKKLFRLYNKSVDGNKFDLKLHFAYYAGEQGHPLANTMFFSSSIIIKDLFTNIINQRSK